MKSTQKFYETKEFKKLFKEWDDKLKAEGLGLLDRPEVILIDPKIYLHFRLCKVYLRSGLIQNKRDRFIFELYTEGVTTTKISEMLNDSEFKAIERRTVEDCIKKIVKRTPIVQVSMMNVRTVNKQPKSTNEKYKEPNLTHLEIKECRLQNYGY